MFKEVTALTRDKHLELRFAKGRGYAFASSLMVCPVMLGEVGLVAREMPIVFSKTDGMPMALLGLKPGHNAYVDPKGVGKWLAKYVPAHVRRYPFMLAEQQVEGQPVPTTGKRSYALMADLEAPHFADATKGDRLFDDQGQPTAVLSQIEKVLMDLQHAHLRTQECVQVLLDSGVLVDRTLQAKTAAGKVMGLEGLKLVDAQKLAELPAEKFAALRQNGALGLVYAHLMSLANLNDAPLKLAEDLVPQPASVLTGDTLPLSGLS